MVSSNGHRGLKKSQRGFLKSRSEPLFCVNDSNEGWTIRNLSFGEVRAILAARPRRCDADLLFWTDTWGHWKEIQDPDCHSFLEPRYEDQNPPSVPLMPILEDQTPPPIQKPSQPKTPPPVVKPKAKPVVQPIVQTMVKPASTTPTIFDTADVDLPPEIASLAQNVAPVAMQSLVRDEKALPHQSVSPHLMPKPSSKPVVPPLEISTVPVIFEPAAEILPPLSAEPQAPKEFVVELLEPSISQISNIPAELRQPAELRHPAALPKPAAKPRMKPVPMPLPEATSETEQPHGYEPGERTEVTSVMPMDRSPKAPRPRTQTSNRKYTRFPVQIPVVIQTTTEQFSTWSVDISEGGIRLKDQLPDQFAGYSQVVLLPRNHPPIHLLGSLVEDQQDGRHHVEFVDSENQAEFIAWMREQDWAQTA